MCVKRTIKDVLKAYKVYKFISSYLTKIPRDDREIYALICTVATLYGGMTGVELEAVLPVSKACLKKVLNEGIYRYRLLDFKEDLALGRDPVGNKISKGVYQLKDYILTDILNRTLTDKISLTGLKNFATLLSNTSAHVNILRNNIKDNNSKFIISHIGILLDVLTNQATQLDRNCTENLARLGYMRIKNEHIELNKSAVLYNGDPKFEITNLQRNS